MNPSTPLAFQKPALSLPRLGFAAFVVAYATLGVGIPVAAQPGAPDAEATAAGAQPDAPHPALPMDKSATASAPPSPTADAGEGEEIDLEALFNTQVEVATKRAQSLAEAPAVVDVITAEDLRERGYVSVAEALRAVPGFYMVDDSFLPSLGVRGIPSGQRAWSRIVKVMIDGTPVPYLPESTNFLGPSLIPLNLIKRIEIIRGPGSALYGADAFLGVVNIVTRHGDDMAGATASTSVGAHGAHGQGRASLVAGYTAPWRDGEAVAGVSGGAIDRSGYGVPDSSPFATRFAGQSAEGDVAYPGSFFGRVGGVPTPLGAFAVDGGFQHVSAGGEFQDFHPFSHDSRITLESRFLHGGLRTEINDKFSTSVNVAYSRGNPGQDDRLSIGNATYRIRRVMGSDGLTAAAEGLYAFDTRNSLSAGADFSRTTHVLPTYFDVYTPLSGRAGQEQQDGPTGETQVFDNVGVYSQGILYVLEDTALTVGVRLDDNSVYGNIFNSRAGLVSPLLPGLSGKVLYGSSFKAPSPQQLFGRPLIFGDILGNPNLRPEQAQTVEAALLYAAGRNLDLLTNAYYTHVTDRIGFLTQGGNSKAVNQSQLDSVGLEGEAKWRWRFLHGMLNMSVQTTAALAQTDAIIDPSTDPSLIQEAYPTYMANAGVGTPVFNWPLGAYLEGRLVGAVPGTQSNFVQNGLIKYELPPTLTFDVTLTSKEWRLGAGALTASLKLSDLLDTSMAQPGYGGIDYPGTGRTVMMRLDYGW